MKMSVKLQGERDIIALLQSLPPEVVSKRGGPVKLALKKGAQVIRAQALANLRRAIEENGEDSTGLLENSVIVSRGKQPRGTKGERYLVRIKRKAYDGNKIGRRQKAGKRVTTHKTASLMEYGSSQQPPRPWLRPAVRDKGAEAISVINSDLLRRIDLTVKRLAKKRRG